MAGLIERYDSALIGILQSEGQIGNFLDIVYGFLYRKTDFFLIMKDKKSRMGFPEGVSMKLAMGAFKKYEALAAKSAKRRQEEEIEKKRAEALKKKKEEAQKKQKEEEEAQKKTEPPKTESVAPEPSEAASKLKDAAPKAAPDGMEGDAVKPIDSKTEAAAASAKQTSTKDTQNGEVAKTNEKKRSGDDDDDDPVLTAQQKKFQANPESYNGAARDNYSWSQSISDVDARIHVPKWVRKGADVRVEIRKKYLKASYKEQDGSFKVVVDEPLTWDINKEESMWSLVPGEHIHVNLEKIQERWWEGLIESEPKISVRKIDPSRPITDLDGEAQAKIEEMVFNEHQKKLGKPQSHEIKVNEMLKNAWDLEGSPFRGQPFDPSKVNIQNPGDFSMGGGPPSAPR